MKIDYHLHGEFSSDSLMSYDKLCSKAIQNGYQEIAITEHFDFLASEIYHFGIPPYENYFRRIREIKNKYPQIKIYCGVELGEYHRIKEIADAVMAHEKPELIIGSIHILSDGKNISIPFNEPMNDAQVRDYYKENLRLVESCDIDILGHLGIFKRYYNKQPDEMQFHPIIDKIFTTMIKKNIALEINYSPLRKSYKQLLPEPLYIKRYLKLGGRLLSIGSDSHSINQFDDHYGEAIAMLKDLGIGHIMRKNESGWERVKI